MLEFLKRYIQQFHMEEIATDWLNKILSLILAYLIFWVLNKILTASIRKVLPSALKISNRDIARQKTLVRLTENTVHYLLYFIVLYSFLSILGLPVSSLLAGAGIAGVAIGLGAQGFLSDLVNGFFILLERQYDVGDAVRVTNGSIQLSGTVVNLGIRTTQIRDFDGTLHFVPNRNILVVSNQSRGDMRARIDIPLSPQTNLEKVYQVVEEINTRELPAHEEIKGATILGPQTLPNGQFAFRVDLFASHGHQVSVYHTFYGLYQEGLLAAGIKLPTSVATFSSKEA